MRRLAFTVALLMVCAARAQQRPPDLSEIASQAAIVFRGQVIAVEVQPPRAPDEIPETRVTFRVQDGVRGTTNGQLLTIRQWNAAADEYRTGESLVLFLHAPSAQLGLTSPVGGRAGHRRLDEVPSDVLNALRAPHEEFGTRDSGVEITDREASGSLPARRFRILKPQSGRPRRVEAVQ